MYVCMYVYIYIYTHIHIHMHFQSGRLHMFSYTAALKKQTISALKKHALK